MADRLGTYRAKRDFGETPEPAGDAAHPEEPASAGRFVVQEHHATRLHWDLRLEHDGALASWAVPNGIPEDPKRNRKAVRTEDHPLEYLDFEGDIPRGQYGAGSMRIWDRGTYEAEKWRDDEVIATFHGERLSGRYALVRTGSSDRPGREDWLMHRMDPAVDPDAEPMPDGLVPMLAKPAALPRGDGWAFEVKWDGVRALVYSEPGRLHIESRNLRDITEQYPELRKLNRALSSHSAILDGEIVAFDENGRPSFSRLQHRMHLTHASEIRRRAKQYPTALMIFDLLWLDGHSLMKLPLRERRERLEALDLNGEAWQTPVQLATAVGDPLELLEAVTAQGLEGLVAKRADSTYEPGRRTSAWVKIKAFHSQEVVIGGWQEGEGRRAERIGSLLVGVREPDGSLRYAGKVGTGFTDETLADLAARLGPLRVERSPFASGTGAPRRAQWVRPELVAEVEFAEWTPDGMLRHPSFEGLRDDKSSREVVREDLFDAVEELPKDAREVTIDGHAVKVSNWSKVLWPTAGFAKGDLVEYMVRIAPALLPHLEGRPLTLKRYPEGVEGPHFFEKQCPSHRPPWVRTVDVFSSRKRGDITFCLAEDRATLVWLANLADIELHTSLSRGDEIRRPTMMVFDLDPGAPADIVQCCEVGLVLRGLFDGVGLSSYAKTSGSKGLQIYVPLNTDDAAYDGPGGTKEFSKTIAEMLEREMPDLVVSRQTKSLRGGKVLVDWSQNDEHKTTVNVYSVRARDRPTVSTPVSWDEVQDCLDARDAGVLVFDTGQVLERVADRGDLFAPVLSKIQRLPAL